MFKALLGERAFCDKDSTVLAGGQVRGEEMENLRDLVEFMAKSLVDKPDSVEVDEIPGQQTTLLALKVDKEDLGKVIGKQGKTAAAMRTIIRAAGTKLNKRYHLDIVE